MISDQANMALWRPWFDEDVSVERQVPSVADVREQVVVDVQPQKVVKKVRLLNKQQRAALKALLEYMCEVKNVAVSPSRRQ